MLMFNGTSRVHKRKRVYHVLSVTCVERVARSNRISESLWLSSLISSSSSTMSDIPALLLASLSPQSRKQAEQSLQSYSLQPAFVTHLLQLVLDGAQDRAVRLAGSVYLKNVVKLRWMEAVCDTNLLPRSRRL